MLALLTKASICNSIPAPLQPADIARLAGASWNFFDPCRDSRLWSRFFVRDFKRPVARGPADEGLPLYIQVTIRKDAFFWTQDVHLIHISQYARKAKRALLRAGPRAIHLDLVADKRDATAVPFMRDIAVRTKDGRALGAMRFVHVSGHRLVVGSTDQGHLAAWAAAAAPRRAGAAVPGAAPAAPMLPGAQCDMFSRGTVAKARHDAKRKYVSRTVASQESRLLYFKIQARNRRVVRYRDASVASPRAFHPRVSSLGDIAVAGQQAESGVARGPPSWTCGRMRRPPPGRRPGHLPSWQPCFPLRSRGALTLAPRPLQMSRRRPLGLEAPLPRQLPHPQRPLATTAGRSPVGVSRLRVDHHRSSAAASLMRWRLATGTGGSMTQRGGGRGGVPEAAAGQGVAPEVGARLFGWAAEAARRPLAPPQTLAAARTSLR